MKRIATVRLALVIAVTTTACTGIDVGNGIVDVDVALYDSGQQQVSSAAQSLSAAPAGLVVTEAWVAVERLRLRDAANCEGSAEAEFVGPFAIDMLAPGTPEALSNLEVAFTDYCRIELRWDSLETAAAGSPSELVGASILIEGTRLDGTPFTLRSDRGDELRLDARDGSFPIDEATSALFVAFDVQTLFDEVNLDEAAVQDGAIRIEADSNDELLEVFDNNLEVAAKLFRDDDGDKELDADERADSEALAD